MGIGWKILAQNFKHSSDKNIPEHFTVSRNTKKKIPNTSLHTQNSVKVTYIALHLKLFYLIH